MSYKIERTLDFGTQYRKLTKKNHTLQERLDKRLTQIIEDPTIGEPKRYNLNILVVHMWTLLLSSI